MNIPALSKRKVKFSALLSGLVAFSVLSTVIILLFASYRSEKDSLISTTLSLNYSLSARMSGTIDSLFLAIRGSLDDTRDYFRENESLSDDDLQSRLELISSTNRYFNSLFWADESGVFRAMAPASIGLRGNKLSTESATSALRSRAPYLSSPYTGVSGRLIVLISEPFFDKNGNYRGMIGGTIYLQENNILNELLGQNATDEYRSYYYVVDNKGKLLYHPEHERLGEDVSISPVVQKLMRQEEGSGLFINTKGEEMAAAFTLAHASQWGIVQQTPLASINERLASHTRKLLLYAAAPFLLLMLLSLLLASRLARPFAALASLASEAAAGRAPAATSLRSHWNKEVDDLTKAVSITIETMQSNNNQLSRKAYTDPLTGLANRGSLAEWLAGWPTGERVYSVIVLDIDHFKLVNDTYGHQAGDEVLRFLAELMRSAAGASGFCFRFGGEEFVILLPDVYASDAMSVAEQLRRTVETTISPVGRPITISLGIAQYPLHAHVHDEVFKLADQALYESKNNGRNRSTIARNGSLSPVQQQA